MVVSEAYLRDGVSVEGEAAIAVGHPAVGSGIEEAEDGVWVLEPVVLAAKTTPDEGWTNWGPNASGRNPARDRFM